ncbi:MAG: UbiA family prenyltransferase [Smithellaceae bacterium]
MITEVIYHNDFREHALFIICLCKAKIALLATLSAVAGLFLASTPSGRLTVVLMLGVFLLASGAGALNHYQERHTDLLMNRTAGRPLPAGRIKPETALFLSILLISSGCVILLAGGSPAAAILGLAAVFWYNGFYTWFKARNSFAAIPRRSGRCHPAGNRLAGRRRKYARFQACRSLFFLLCVAGFFIF